MNKPAINELQVRLYPNGDYLIVLSHKDGSRISFRLDTLGDARTKVDELLPRICPSLFTYEGDKP